MKGLLIKDLRLILKQKTVFVLILIIAILNIGDADAAFMSGYMIFVGTFIAINTISYDSFDNGMAFLMTMPSGRKNYAVEKYVFTIAMSVAITLLTLLFAVVASMVKNGGSDLLQVVAVVLVVFVTALIAACIMIPVNLKFGAEKGRILLFAVVGIIVAVIYLIEKYVENAAVWVVGLLERMGRMSGLMLSVLLGMFVIAVVAVSFLVTIKVMNNKEF